MDKKEQKNNKNKNPKLLLEIKLSIAMLAPLFGLFWIYIVV